MPRWRNSENGNGGGDNIGVTAASRHLAAAASVAASRHQPAASEMK
jgi:hypothetical protein